MLGVSIPKVRKLAKEIIKDNPAEYLKQPAEEYYEELLLQALVIANLKIELEKKKEYIINFVPKINCWAVCDSFCAGLKDADKNQQFFWKIISKYFKSFHKLDKKSNYNVIRPLCKRRIYRQNF